MIKSEHSIDHSATFTGEPESDGFNMVTEHANTDTLLQSSML